MKLRLLAAAVAMHCWSEAGAQIIPGSPNGNSGEIILNAYWAGTDGETRTADDVTFNLDTGITVNAFLAKTSAERAQLRFDFSNDPNWTPLKGKSAVVWNLYAGNVGAGVANFGLPGEASTPKWGFLTTINGGSANLDPLFGITGPGNVTAKIDAQANAIDAVNGSTVYSDNLTTLVLGDIPANFDYFGGNFQGGWGNDNQFPVDQDASIAFIGRDKTSGTPSNPVKIVKTDLAIAHLSSAGVLSFSTATANNPPTGTVTISGTAQVGQTLTASNTLADADGPATLTVSYQWKANGIAINGATGNSYQLTQAELGKTITVTASYTDSLSNLESKDSAATSAVIAAPNNAPTGVVTITGTAQVGQTLTAINTLADADGPATLTVSYQWKANGTAINGATNANYTLTQAELGKTITVTASYTDSLSNLESKTSDPTSAVTAAANHAPTGSVTIDGTVQVGQTLTANTSTLADADGPNPLTGFSYQWKANGTAINGATGSTYKLTQAELGKTITVTVSYTDNLSNVESKDSAATAAVAAAPNQAPTGVVTITGTAQVGQTLTASNTLADADGPATLTVSYQWKANGTAINGATGNTYQLTQADLGKTITVTASYTDSLSNLESKTSDATSAVIAAVVNGPNIAVSDKSLSFGTIAVGKFGALKVIVRNTGNAALNIGEPSIQGAAYSLVSKACEDKALAPGKSCLLSVKFKPTSTGDALGAIVIPSNDADENPLTIDLNGTGGIPGPVIVSGVEPGTIGASGALTVSGEGFGLGGKLFIGSKPAKIVPNGWQDDSILAYVPPQIAGHYEVKVVRKGENAKLVNAQEHIDIAAPRIDGLSSTSGAKNSQITISGQYFGLAKPTVSFTTTGTPSKKTPAPAKTAPDDNSVDVLVPKSLKPGTYNVQVGTSAGTSNTISFTVTP